MSLRNDIKVWSFQSLTRSSSPHFWVGEVSELTNGTKAPWYGPIYADAVDIGCYLESHVTGDRVLFYVESIKCDTHGSVLFWDLMPVKPHPRIKGIRIFND